MVVQCGSEGWWCSVAVRGGEAVRGGGAVKGGGQAVRGGGGAVVQ